MGFSHYVHIGLAADKRSLRVFSLDIPVAPLVEREQKMPED